VGGSVVAVGVRVDVEVAVGVTGVWVAVKWVGVALGVTGVAVAGGTGVLVGISVAVGVLVGTGVLVEVTGKKPVGVGPNTTVGNSVADGSVVTVIVAVAVGGGGMRCTLGAAASATKPKQ